MLESVAKAKSDILTEIYKYRCTTGVTRQPHHRKDLRDLRKIIKEIPQDHPYRLKDYEPLYRSAAFDPGACGSSLNTKVVLELYRLGSLDKVVEHVTDWTFKKTRGRRPYSEPRLFFHLSQYYRNEGKPWLPLSRFATGELSGIRKFTWWTTSDLDVNDIVCASHNLGLPNSWIPKYALLLRCHREASMVSIPSVLDGFCSVIFNAADYRGGSPTSGQTIDLDTEPLALGHNEFVLKPIDVDSVEVKPILIDQPKRLHHVVRMDGKLLRLLHHYYIRNP